MTSMNLLDFMKQSKNRVVRKLRAGIIGLGVGEKHIHAYQSHSECEVVALCDFAEEKLAIARERYPGMKLVNNAKEIMEDPTIDVVSIASYDDYHFQQVMSCLRKGKHVFVEKPLCLYSHEAVVIRQFLNKNPHLKISCNLNLRTCPRFKWLRNAIQSELMGQIYYVEADYFWGRIYKLTVGWRKDMDFYSIVHGAAVHMIDLILWLTDMSPIEVQGCGNQIVTYGSDFRFNDFAVILIKFENGTIAKVTGNGGCVHPHFHRIVLFGTKKTFIHDISGGRLLESRDPQANPRNIDEEYPGREKDEIIYTFVDSILHDDKEAIVPTDDVFKTMSICFAAEKAIRAGKPVTVEYI